MSYVRKTISRTWTRKLSKVTGIRCDACRKKYRGGFYRAPGWTLHAAHVGARVSVDRGQRRRPRRLALGERHACSVPCLVRLVERMRGRLHWVTFRGGAGKLARDLRRQVFGRIPRRGAP